MTQAQNVAIESSQINSSGVLLTAGGGTGLSTVGTNGQVLTSNGTTLSWVTPTTTSPGGSSGQVQYNSSGSFAGSANFYWDNTNGRLGIGTSSPAYTLDVANQIRLTAGLTISPSTSSLYSTDGTLSFYGTTNAVYLNGTATGWLNIQADGTQASYIKLNGSSYSTPNQIQFYTGAAQRMNINANGYIGINTASPSSILHISGANTYAGGGLLLGSAGVSSGYLWTTDNLYIKPNTAANTTSGAVYIQNFSGTTQMAFDASTGKILNASLRPMLNQTGGALQVVSAYSTTTVSTTNTYSGAVSTTITATITPSNTSTKILIQASVECYGNNATGANLAIFRNGTNLTAGGQNFLTRSYPLNSQLAINVPVLYIDSPASTSAQTYTIYLWSTASGASATTGQDNTQQWIVLTEIAQ